MVALLVLMGADGVPRAFTEAGALPLPLLDIGKPSTLKPVLWADGKGWVRIVPRSIGTAPDLMDWLTELVDYDTPIQTVTYGRLRTRASVYAVP
jgi:hypothetical protein